ncbi:hypothetical protein BGW38_003140 [Lunasporangiospora selenospora]|uniref:BTB domain-containing protein n=1 Tax=Lunasporangiospora selenospora TaxID=979761 RepID=A0A9P6KHL3_9FUNG|nr:hypothetical protein BGW38_003140 [Lunasporangiospora selenospora]
MPRLTKGERMTCIVNASITCVSAPITPSSSGSDLVTKRGRASVIGHNSVGGNSRNNSQDSLSFYSAAHEASSSSRQRSVSSNHRSGHGSQEATQLEQNRMHLYVFGGFHQYSDVVNNDLYRLDVETMTWEQLIYTKGEPPSKRNDHSACLWGEDRIVIFGGSDERNQFLSDVHVLHVRTLTWETPTIRGSIPEGRAKHAATIVNDKLYLSGGCLEDDVISQELFCLDLLTWEWDEPIDFVARYTHTLFDYRNKLLVYGGYNEDMDRTEVIAYMDLETLQVTKVSVTNEIAPYVAAHQYSQVCGRHLVVVISQGLRVELQKFTGGIWTLDLDSFKWTKHDDWKILGESYTWQCWHYFAMERDSEQFYLIGDVNDSDEYFRQVLTVDLREYGAFLDTPSAIGYELGRLLQDQMSLADFRILCAGTDGSQTASFHGPGMSSSSVMDSGGENDMMIDSHPPVTHIRHQLRSQRQTPSSSRAHSPQHEPIMCHKLILMARWPHFAGMVHSGMMEAQTSTLTLPEPYESVRGFIDYLYRDSIEGFSTEVIADLMVMGSMYMMKRLVHLCTSALHHQIDIETVSIIYHRAGYCGQMGLRHRALKFMFRNYGPVSKTMGFRSLPKEALLDFWDSTPEGAVINIAV